MQALETERLLLRDWQMADVDDLYAYAKSPIIGPSAGWAPHKDKEESKKVLRSFILLGEMWAIYHKADRRVIGSIGVHTDAKRRQIDTAKMLGYTISEEYWGMGLATEAARAVICFTFLETPVQMLSAYHYPFNVKSGRVLKKCGFRFEGVLRYASCTHDREVADNACYSLLKEDFSRI